ncbi:hypothetical protein CBR_g22125 [Chara braunii]|uniref:Uncharacterized protein n=1 Tax=Chara braunii TaxID=69332 RepID=A0A388L285_CHABU|nr:hypothetical protein CBR_g22125 [Chara braunii]|eukprot:GBG76378.1 hypothetical protein CBR_g22125 [Chara braunii]
MRDPCGLRAPPGEDKDVFGTRAATLWPYPIDDDSGDEGPEGLEERAGPANHPGLEERAGPANHPAGGPGEADEWSDLEEVHRRSGGGDLFGGSDGSPFERERPSSSGPQSVDTQAVHDSARSRGAESACGGGIAGQHPERLRSGMVQFQTSELDRGSPPRGRLHRMVKGPRQRLEKRLVGGSLPTERVERVVERPTGRRTPPFGGDGRSPIQEAVQTQVVGGGVADRLSMGGRGGFSQIGDLGLLPGESDYRGDVSAGMQAILEQISAMQPETFTLAMRGELGAPPTEIERDEEATPPGETSAERLDRLNSRMLSPKGLVTPPHKGSKGRRRIGAARQRAGTISRTTGWGGDVGGDAVVGGVEERVHADPVSLVEGGRHAEDNGGAGARQEAIRTLDRGRHEASRSLVVCTVVRPVVRHEAPFPIDPMRPTGGVSLIVQRRVGRGMCAPPIPPFASSRERTQSRYAPHPRGTLPFGCMIAEELEAHGTMDYTGIDTG